MIRRGTKKWASHLLRKAMLPALALLTCTSAQAQDRVAAFYSGRTISITIAYPPGGSYDIYSRLAAAHMSKYIPGRPNFIVQNKPGGIGVLRSFSEASPKDGSMIGTVGGGCVEAEVWTAAREVIETDKPRHLNFSLGEDAAYDNGLICGGQLNIFVEPVTPQPRAFIFGGGHVSKSLSKVANLAGFATVIIDDREAFANKERFPEADEVYAEEYESVFPKLTITSTSYLIIVTRGHRDDMRVLRWAVETPAKYVAMIGSKRKTISVVKELEKEGFPRHLFEKIFAPMGLEIGAETPEEIAISVVGEMIAMRRAPDVDWRSLSKSVFAHDNLRALLK